MGAAADCETIGSGFLGQPVNTLTTIGFVVVGLLIVIRRRDRAWIGIALAATGIGSLLFHGPMPAGSEWAHDVTLAWLLAVVAGEATRWERPSRILALAALGVLFAMVPATADPVAVGLTAVALISLPLRDRSAATLAPLALLAAVAVYGRAGATGGPLCEPDSLLQPHGIWHLGASIAVGWWAMGSSVPVDQSAISR